MGYAIYVSLIGERADLGSFFVQSETFVPIISFLTDHISFGSHIRELASKITINRIPNRKYPMRYSANVQQSPDQKMDNRLSVSSRYYRGRSEKDRILTLRGVISITIPGAGIFTHSPRILIKLSLAQGV